LIFDGCLFRAFVTPESKKIVWMMKAMETSKPLEKFAVI
jgi:hypothetical protein